MLNWLVALTLGAAAFAKPLPETHNCTTWAASAATLVVYPNSREEAVAYLDRHPCQVLQTFGLLHDTDRPPVVTCLVASHWKGISCFQGQMRWGQNYR